MNIDFEKGNGLVPVIVQDFYTLQVLMQGYMNPEALQKTLRENRVTFFSRTKNRLWTKGEESGNYLEVKEILEDCDQDSLLIKAIPHGPTCHTGSQSCFQEKVPKGFLYQLEKIIHEKIDCSDPNSYTRSLFQKGINKIAQKVGEEAVELVIESKDSNENLLKNEAADLLYHLLILLKAKQLKLQDIEQILLDRNEP